MRRGLLYTQTRVSSSRKTVGARRGEYTEALTDGRTLAPKGMSAHRHRPPASEYKRLAGTGLMVEGILQRSTLGLLAQLSGGTVSFFLFQSSFFLDALPLFLLAFSFILVSFSSVTHY